jgi:hypothetical protein
MRPTDYFELMLPLPRGEDRGEGALKSDLVPSIN